MHRRGDDPRGPSRPPVPPRTARDGSPPASGSGEAPKREALAGHFLFQGLSESQIELLARMAVRRRLPPRCEVFRKGDESQEAYAILSGRLRATSSSPEGREVTLSLMGPGELVGEVAMLCGGRRTLTVETLEPSEPLVIQRRDLNPLLQSHPAAGVAMMGALAERLTQLTELFEDASLVGRSAVYDPWGTRRAAIGDEPGLIVADVEPDRVAERRAEFPVLDDRRR